MAKEMTTLEWLATAVSSKKETYGPSDPMGTVLQRDGWMFGTNRHVIHAAKTDDQDEKILGPDGFWLPNTDGHRIVKAPSIFSGCAAQFEWKVTGDLLTLLKAQAAAAKVSVDGNLFGYTFYTVINGHHFNSGLLYKGLLGFLSNKNHSSVDVTFSATGDDRPLIVFNEAGTKVFVQMPVRNVSDKAALVIPMGETVDIGTIKAIEKSEEKLESVPF